MSALGRSARPTASLFGQLLALIAVLYLMAPTAQELGRLALSLRLKLGGRA